MVATIPVVDAVASAINHNDALWLGIITQTFGFLGLVAVQIRIAYVANRERAANQQLLVENQAHVKKALDTVVEQTNGMSKKLEQAAFVRGVEHGRTNGPDD